MIFGGIDLGSRTTKVVLWDSDNATLRASGSIDQGVEQASMARKLLDQLLDENEVNPSSLGGIVATGYGRNLVKFAGQTVTEITCHARGVRHWSPEVRTIIEIGGQDSKVIRLNAQGAVHDFAMNDRCAAGTGRFLEMVATRLGVRLQELGELAGKSRKPASISSMCVVFAETEIIGLLAGGKLPSDIVAGVQASVATRVAGLAGRSLQGPVHFTGGVALIPGMAAALESALGQRVVVPTKPMLTGALGAALLAARHQESRS
jgi:(R)-2-hydroxyacyl-CoA dehydratese activating ATPase